MLKLALGVKVSDGVGIFVVCRVCRVPALQGTNLLWLWAGAQGDRGRDWPSDRGQQGDFKHPHQPARLLTTRYHAPTFPLTLSPCFSLHLHCFFRLLFFWLFFCVLPALIFECQITRRACLCTVCVLNVSLCTHSNTHLVVLCMSSAFLCLSSVSLLYCVCSLSSVSMCFNSSVSMCVYSPQTCPQ